MLNIVTTEKNKNTIFRWFKKQRRYFKKCVQLQFYEQVAIDSSSGDWLFTDTDRLAHKPELREHIEKLLLTIEKSGGRIYNHPFTVLNRYDLYKNLELPFKAYRSVEDYSNVKFPVYLRYEDEHHSRSDLIHDMNELEKNLSTLSDCLICEYFDISDKNGLFTKYSAFLINDKIIPRHVLFSQNWVVKTPDIQTKETLNAEAKYVLKNPHKKEIREIFNTANIDYGRIDYSIYNSQLITWEINTNPTLTLSPKKWNYVRSLVFKYTSVLINRELLALAGKPHKNIIAYYFWTMAAKALL